jgi:CRP-like cAMP-binding protein
MPDAQSLFLSEMDHSVCAIKRATVGIISHADLFTLFDARPQIGRAIWRETLIDAAMFRQTVVNNSARAPLSRMAHFFCEHYYRSFQSAPAANGQVYFPLTQSQLADALGMSIVTANRTLQKLRRTQAMDWHADSLVIKDWAELCEIGDFNPRYLHGKPES